MFFANQYSKSRVTVLNRDTAQLVVKKLDVFLRSSGAVHECLLHCFGKSYFIGFSVGLQRYLSSCGGRAKILVCALASYP